MLATESVGFLRSCFGSPAYLRLSFGFKGGGDKTELTEAAGDTRVGGKTIYIVSFKTAGSGEGDIRRA